MEYILLPLLGLQTNVPPNDPSLLKSIGDNIAISHCVDCAYISLTDRKNSVSKAPAKTQWSNSATSDTLNCLGMFELDDGSNRTHWLFMGDNSSKGRIFRYDGSRDPIRISDDADHSGATEWAYDNLDKYSIIRVGDYMVFTDYGEHTPYASDYNDTVLAKLVSADTEYKGKFLGKFMRRILLLNITSGITTGAEYSIIWTGLDPVPTSSCTFGSGDPPSNHLYVPNEDPITGGMAYGRDNFFVYCEDSISRMYSTSNYSTPYAIVNMVEGQGSTNHNSIVSDGKSHYFFNENYGFVEYRGGSDFPYGGRPISDPIENKVANIARTYYRHIQGRLIPHKQQIWWTVPLDGSSTPTHILKFHLTDRTWTIDPMIAWFIDNWVTDTNVSWNDLLAQGYSTWAEIADMRWADIVSENPYVMLSSTDGKSYSKSGTSDAGSDYDGFRTEPILDFGRPNDYDFLREIWFDFTTYGSFNLYVKYRGGDSPAEVEAEPWTTLPEISCNKLADAVTYLGETNRYHQIKYGTDSENENFSVNRIKFIFEPGGSF